MNFTSDQWLIVALVFVLGLLIGVFLTAGGGRKWKTATRKRSTRRERARNKRPMRQREKEWREQDSLRAAALKDRDRDATPLVDERDDRDRVTATDADRVRDDRDPVDDRQV